MVNLPDYNRMYEKYKDKLKSIYGKCFLDNIYSASPTYKNNICKVNECEIGVHYFQELNDDNKLASEFREIINLELEG